jgi:hypothetical protein
VANFILSSQGLRLAFDTPLTAWQYTGAKSTLAVRNALAQSLGLTVDQLWMYQVSGGARGGTVIEFDILSPQQVSTEIAPGLLAPGPAPAGQFIPKVFADFVKLFDIRNGNPTNVVGGELCLNELVSSLQSFGLRVSTCYLFDQPSL